MNLKLKNEKLFSLLAWVAVVLLIALFFLIVVLVQNQIREGRYIGQEIESRNTITVSDSGEVYAKPDLAVANFGVVNEAETVAEAINENTQKMNAVIVAIKNEGVEEKDLKTTTFNLYPRYEWRDGDYYEGERVLVGYEVRQNLEVKIRNMGKIGDIIQKATQAGSNQVGDLQFTIDNEEELKKQARNQAIGKAKTKAQELAQELDVDLVRIVSFNESSSLPYYYALEKAVGAGMVDEESSPQIETGESKITVAVNITYEIN
jgi:uncharacterized protein YggE